MALFFGLSDVLSVVSNPTAMLRNLSESKKLLAEARQEIKDNIERSQIPPIHSFSPLPGFFDRPHEIKTIEKVLSGIPAFVILFGASSVGKTALCRQVLSQDRYHVLNFDLRIAGFADLTSLYLSLSQQLESYFAKIPDLMGKEWGWGEFEKESWAFKYDRVAFNKRLASGDTARPSDISRLMELYQSALLKYWEFKPMTNGERKKAEKEKENQKELDKKAKKNGQSVRASTVEDPTPQKSIKRISIVGLMSKSESTSSVAAPIIDLYTARSLIKKNDDEEADAKGKGKGKQMHIEGLGSVSAQRAPDAEGAEGAEEEEPEAPPKRVPVFFMDEAHKLPALIDSRETLKALLDAMLVLTKQDRLTHVIQCTSDPFYLHWLRQLNVMHHCTMITMGDCSKQEAQKYYETQLARHIPDELRIRWSFEELYQVFGGKLAHLSDYVSECINSEGEVEPLESSHFIQAYSLLNLNLVHALPSDGQERGRGLEVYSPLDPMNTETGSKGSDFSYDQLLSILREFEVADRNRQDIPVEVPYFGLCKKYGTRAVDGIVRARILELRWANTVKPEGDEVKTAKRSKIARWGPTLLPTTPVMWRAINLVLEEMKAEEAPALTILYSKEKAEQDSVDAGVDAGESEFAGDSEHKDTEEDKDAQSEII